MICLNSICLFLCMFMLLTVFPNIEGAEYCGIRNGEEYMCMDPDLPYCCGFSEEGEALCCAEHIKRINPDPEFCGSNKGHDWYCADLAKPRCCGYRYSDGAALCCPSLLPEMNSTFSPEFDLTNTAEYCGIRNGKEHMCTEASRPYCCGFSEEGEALCCAEQVKRINPDPTYCGFYNGHEWYCSDLTKPRCCGDRDGDGAALCCPSLLPETTSPFLPGFETTEFSTKDEDYTARWYSEDNIFSDHVTPDDLTDDKFNNEDVNDDNLVSNDVTDDNYDENVDNDNNHDYVAPDDYETTEDFVIYNKWYVYVGCSFGFFCLVVIIIMIRRYAIRQYCRNQTNLMAVKIQPHQHPNKSFDNPIKFSEDKPPLV